MADDNLGKKSKLLESLLTNNSQFLDEIETQQINESIYFDDETLSEIFLKQVAEEVAESVLTSNLFSPEAQDILLISSGISTPGNLSKEGSFMEDGDSAENSPRPEWQRICVENRICIHNIHGNCAYGPQCFYKHLDNFKKADLLFKTEICRYGNECTNQVRCNFAHSDEERHTPEQNVFTALSRLQQNPHLNGNGNSNGGGGGGGGVIKQWPIIQDGHQQIPHPPPLPPYPSPRFLVSPSPPFQQLQPPLQHQQSPYYFNQQYQPQQQLQIPQQQQQQQQQPYFQPQQRLLQPFIPQNYKPNYQP